MSDNIECPNCGKSTAIEYGDWKAPRYSQCPYCRIQLITDIDSLDDEPVITLTVDYQQGIDRVAQRIDPAAVSILSADEMTSLDKAKTDYEILTSDYEELAHEVLEIRAQREALRAALVQIIPMAQDNRNDEIIKLANEALHPSKRTQASDEDVKR